MAKIKTWIAPIVGEAPFQRVHARIEYYTQARRFEVSAGIIHRATQDNLIEVPTYFESSVPVVVNHSLALELYFKCLLQIEDKLGVGHELDVLFSGLEPTRQARIEKAFQASGKVPPLIPGMTVASVLGRCKNAFIEWRFLNEHKPMTHEMYDATLVTSSVRGIIWEDYPSLKNVLPIMPWEA